jgi:heat shock protein HslJ
VTPRRPSLVGRWLVEDIGGMGVLDGAPPTLDFGDDGALSGSANLNRIRGRYEVIDAVLHTSPLMTTRMAGPPAVMEQERRLVEALEAGGPITEDEPFLLIGGEPPSLRLVRDDEPVEALDAVAAPAD